MKVPLAGSDRTVNHLKFKLIFGIEEWHKGFLVFPHISPTLLHNVDQRFQEGTLPPSSVKRSARFEVHYQLF